MPFNKRTAKAAAKKRWKANAQPTYDKTPLPTVRSDQLTELGAELPVTFNALAGMMPKWVDPVLELSPTAYKETRQCHAVVKADRKMAIRTQKLNWTMVDGRPEPEPMADKQLALVEPTPKTQSRAEAFAEIFGQIENWSGFIEHCTGSVHEGTRFIQIKRKPPREGSSQAWAIPSFFLGGRHRFNAGGDIEWDGAERLVQVERTTGQETRRMAKLPLDQFAIHRPGAGSNPEGDLDLGVALYNAVVKPANKAITSGTLWVQLFAIPAVLMGAKLDGTLPDRVSTMLQNRAMQLQAALAEQGATTALSNEDVVNLLQADPGGLTGMVAWLQYLEGVADDILTMGALLSSAGIGQATRTGNTQTMANEKDDAAFANGVQIAETFNRHVMPWIIANNPDLPPLEDGEMEVYLWPDNPHEQDEQDISVDGEGVDPSAQEQPADMAMIALRQIVQLQKKKTAR